jgi:2,4-dienoyl-CoA reductase-like NADH-dependent reductase (Old Yellow Enzyme family)/thioredoxin reductase
MKLFEPVSIGAMTLKNRIVMAATGTNFPGDGSVTQRAIDFYSERAKGGAGLIVVEGTGIDPEYGRAMPSQINLLDDHFLPSFEKLNDVMKSQGAKTCIQLHHPGALASSQFIGKQPLSPSGVSLPTLWDIPRTMTPEEIGPVVQVHVDAARRAKGAGFDSIQIVGHEGLTQQYLSPYYNRREDEYGGDIHGRMRLLIEIVKGVRNEVGEGFPLLCRINGEDKPCHITVDDSRVVASAVEKAGVDAIEVVNGSMFESLGFPQYSAEVPQGGFVSLADGIRRGAAIPVICNMRIKDPRLAEQILREGQADLVSMSRALLADPQLPNTTAAGQVKDIRPCIACMTCLDAAWKGSHVQCAVNAQTGFEAERPIQPAHEVKEVMVIGGGPGGLEAARVAAMRGHHVSLYEKESQLGGQLLVASKPPHKDEIEGLVDYLTTQIEKYGVITKLGQTVTPGLVREEKPDMVVVATGAQPERPQIDMEEQTVLLPGDVLCEKTEVGRTVIVIGGGLVGAETAEFLARRNRRVSIVEILDTICGDMAMFAREDLLRRLGELGVNILTETRVDRIRGRMVSLRKGEETQDVYADTFVIATGSKPDRVLADELQGLVPELYTVGDCQEPRRVFDAIHEGFLASNSA